MKYDNLNKSLVIALADSTTQAKLRSICGTLNHKVAGFDTYGESVQVNLLEMVQYGIYGTRFITILGLFDDSKRSKAGTI